MEEEITIENISYKGFIIITGYRYIIYPSPPITAHLGGVINELSLTHHPECIAGIEEDFY